MIATEAHSYYVSFFCYLFTRSKYRAGSFFYPQSQFHILREMDELIEERLWKTERLIEEAAKEYKLNIEELKELIARGKESDANETALHYALNRIAMDEPDWTFLAARLYLQKLYKGAAENRGYDENLNTAASLSWSVHWSRRGYIQMSSSVPIQQANWRKRQGRLFLSAITSSIILVYFCWRIVI